MTNRDVIKFHPTTSTSLTIRLSPKLARSMGHVSSIFIHLNDKNVNTMRINQSLMSSLTKEDCYIEIFDWNVVQKEAEIIIKRAGEDLLKPEELMRRWNKQISPYTNCKMKFSKHGKCILKHFQDKAAIVMDENLATTISHSYCLFGNTEYWAWYKYGDKANKPKDHEWRVRIYKDQLRPTYEYKNHQFEYEVFPRRHSVPSLLKELSEGLTKKLKEKTAKKLEIKFSLDNNYTKIELPHQSFLQFTSNLAKMLGFDQTKFLEGTHISRILPATLDQHEQEIFVYTDLCDPMSYGNQQRRILQSFIHNKDKEHGMVERWFEPINYMSMMKQTIDSIIIKLLDKDGQPLPMFYGKTVATLQFRQV